MEVVHQVISRMSNLPGMKERLLAIFKELFVYLEDNRDLAKVVYFELFRSQMLMEQEGKQVKAFQAALLPIMKEGIALKELKGHMDPESLSSLLISIYFQTVMNWLSFPDQVQNPVSMFLDQFEMVWEGIGVSKKGG
ncbi:TetR/AcrR family transcriptional regulator C-terminal domain-containing protein [Paenibacillus sp. J31TS4]|uniref:TetR/AcrR family transcriptional regulator C-terminal domain-containing protein n=1 Tax=Paenibacillus sp. J31TS4 TaxID=2807195 RepID=UPI0024BEE990|nr:TetR/AcrR family transcriptional regulator C-terminal domain-containing protein [Paenibacillus sp. J31TS4]